MGFHGSSHPSCHPPFFSTQMTLGSLARHFGHATRHRRHVAHVALGRPGRAGRNLSQRHGEIVAITCYNHGLIVANTLISG